MGLASIQFNSHSIKFTLPQKTLTRDWLIAAAKKEGQHIEQLSYIFCNDAYLLQINQEYLRHTTFTDIITFDLSEKRSAGIEGDIFISIDRVKDNARQFNVPFQNELKRVMIHGLLHLMGYKDKKPADKIQMRKAEDRYLALNAKMNK